MNHFWKNLFDPLHNIVYVKVYKNKYEILDVKTGEVINCKADHLFTTRRLLVGEYNEAAYTLKNAMKPIVSHSFPLKPLVLIHPMEMVEDGLSTIEDRIFREIAMDAGARKAHVYIGTELNQQSVRQYLENLAR